MRRLADCRPGATPGTPEDTQRGGAPKGRGRRVALARGMQATLLDRAAVNLCTRTQRDLDASSRDGEGGGLNAN